jgi:hypothetical protein
VDGARATADFEVDGKKYAAGSFVIPMTQVFARYAKDILEKQTYPEVRRSPTSPPEPPYDVTAWSLGMLLGVEHAFVKSALPDTLKLEKLTSAPKMAGKVTGTGAVFTFDYAGPDGAAAINALFKQGAKVSLEPARATVTGATRKQIEDVATAFGLDVKAVNAAPAATTAALRIRAPRLAMYQPWAGGNMDEGWTRWVLEQYGFQLTSVHNDVMRAGSLKDKFDVIILADQSPQAMTNGATGNSVRPEYRGGIGDEGVDALKKFVAAGGTLVTLGAASDFAIENFPVPVRNAKRGLTRDEHFAPGTVVHVEVDTTNPVGYGMAAETYGFYNNSPFFTLVEGFASQKTSVVARYPNRDVVASGWLKGEELMTGRAAVVSVEMNPGRIVLFGLRPQHRAQTHATFPMLFNALYLATTDAPTKAGS